jgi:hypothetical protein
VRADVLRGQSARRTSAPQLVRRTRDERDDGLHLAFMLLG